MEKTEFDLKVLSQKDRMFRLAKSLLRDAADAEDAVQDVLVKLWIGRAKLSGYENLRAFVLTAVKNICLDRLRSRKTKECKKAFIAVSSPTVEDPRQRQEVSDMQSVAQALIAALPEKQRMIIHLRDVEGFPMEEISKVVGMDGDSVRVYLSRARRTVREKLITIMNYGIR